MGFLDMLRPKFGNRPHADNPAPQPPPAATTPPPAAAPVTAAAQGKTYTVKSGDTLSKIAKEQLGDASKYPQIFEANRAVLKDPDKIFPGQVLTIPSGSGQLH